jgi:hypothetical protein
VTNAEWAVCATALESFPGDFPPRSADAYRHLLDGLTQTEVLEAIRRHVRLANRWRPSPGEIMGLSGRSVGLPPFGPVREALTLACRTNAVRLARTDVTGAICARVEPVVAAFVSAVGGERIRRVVLYTEESWVERGWQALERDYTGLENSLLDSAFSMIERAERPELTA